MYTLYAVTVSNNGSYLFTELATGSRNMLGKMMNDRAKAKKSDKSAIYLGRHFVSSNA